MKWVVGVVVIVIVGIGAFLFLHNYSQNQNGPVDDLRPHPVTPTAFQSGNIVVYSPIAKETIGKMYTVTGRARVFENVVFLRLTNTRDNKVYVLAVTDAKSPDAGQFGNFRYTINLSATSLADVKPQDKLLLEVFQQSPKDGSEIDKVSIPLIFSQ